MKMFAFQLGRRNAAEDSSRLTKQTLLALGAGERDSTPQASLFDNLARSVASTTSRRGALRVALTGLAGLALSKIGINTAWAAANCLCNGTVYDSATACCTATGVVQKNPIADLARCPGKVAHAGHTCVPNGCGGNGGIGVPNRFLAANFLPACNTHDCCYDRCNSVKVSCDTDFHSTLRTSCTAAYPGAGFIESRKRALCLSTADTYYDFVDSEGRPYYNEGQRQSCDCCGNVLCAAIPMTIKGAFNVRVPLTIRDVNTGAFICAGSVAVSGILNIEILPGNVLSKAYMTSTTENAIACGYFQSIPKNFRLNVRGGGSTYHAINTAVWAAGSYTFNFSVRISEDYPGNVGNAILTYSYSAPGAGWYGGTVAGAAFSLTK